MVIRMANFGTTNNGSTATSPRGRAASKKVSKHCSDTKAEFRRLKTILPSIKRKENVSRLDIILEAIKYIDDLQDQLVDRLSRSSSADACTTAIATVAKTGVTSAYSDESMEEVSDFEDDEDEEDLEENKCEEAAAALVDEDEAIEADLEEQLSSSERFSSSAATS